MLDYETVKNWSFSPIALDWSKADTARYALSINIGADAMDPDQIAMATGTAPALFPTMAAMLGRPGHWLSDPRTGVDYTKMLIGEVSLQVQKPLPAEGQGVARNSVVSVSDKGEGRGALVVVERRIEDAAGETYYLFRLTSFCRADGGFSKGRGGDAYVSAVAAFPEGLPFQIRQIPTLPQQALLFALNGDYNPIHISPERARAANLAAPVLHGMGTLGLLVAGLMQALGDPQARGLRAVAGRFAAPVYPGEALQLEWICMDDTEIRFRVRSLARDALVFDAGILQRE